MFYSLSLSRKGGIFYYEERNVKTSNIPEMSSYVDNRKYNLEKSSSAESHQQKMPVKNLLKKEVPISINMPIFMLLLPTRNAVRICYHSFCIDKVV